MYSIHLRNPTDKNLPENIFEEEMIKTLPEELVKSIFSFIFKIPRVSRNLKLLVWQPISYSREEKAIFLQFFTIHKGGFKEILKGIPQPLSSEDIPLFLGVIKNFDLIFKDSNLKDHTKTEFNLFLETIKSHLLLISKNELVTLMILLSQQRSGLAAEHLMLEIFHLLPMHDLEEEEKVCQIFRDYSDYKFIISLMNQGFRECVNWLKNHPKKKICWESVQCSRFSFFTLFPI